MTSGQALSCTQLKPINHLQSFLRHRLFSRMRCRFVYRSFWVLKIRGRLYMALINVGWWNKKKKIRLCTDFVWNHPKCDDQDPYVIFILCLWKYVLIRGSVCSSDNSNALLWEISNISSGMDQPFSWQVLWVGGDLPFLLVFFFFVNPIISPGIVIGNSHPLATSPLSHNSYQPGRLKANTCFLSDTWIQLQHLFKLLLMLHHRAVQGKALTAPFHI